MLSDRHIRALPRPDRDILIPAGGRDGLYLRHRATGRKTWVLRRRINGAWRVETLGDWPILSTLNARRRVAATDAAPARPLTFGDAVEDFHAQVIVPRYRAAPGETKAYFIRDCAALLGRPLDRIRRKEIVEVIRAKAGTPNAATKLLVLLKQLFRWALVGELIDADPTSGLTQRALSLPGYEPRERVISDEELRTLWALPDEPYGRLLRFCLLTACRIGEARAMKPDQIVGDVWTIPITKNGRPHTLPLTAPAAVLAAAGWPRRGEKTLYNFLDSRGIGWRPHDLRRSAATRMRDSGISVEVIEAILNHAPPRLVRVYQRPNMLPAMRQALEVLAVEVQKIVGP